MILISHLAVNITPNGDSDAGSKTEELLSCQVCSHRLYVACKRKKKKKSVRNRNGSFLDKCGFMPP